jgi:hypothetical protein
MKAARSGMVVAIVALVLVGCATFERDTYRTLATAAATYENGMSALADLDKQGKLPAAERAQIKTAAIAFWSAYHAAADALAAWVRTKDKATEERVVLLVGQMTGALAQLLGNLAPFIVPAKEVAK